MSKSVAWGFIVLSWLVGLPLAGYAVSAYWNWFVAPIAKLDEISMSKGFGLYLSIYLVAQFLREPRNFKKPLEELDSDPWKWARFMFYKSIGYPIFFLVVGRIVESFINSN